MNNLSAITSLDNIRIENGIDNLRSFFYQQIRNDIKEAIKLINDENLHFASLFVLKPEIEKLDILNKLNTRNRIALGITNEILTKQNNVATGEYLSSDYIQAVCSVLKWMIGTGAADDGLNNQYDEVMDITAILLTKVYKDKTMLPTMTDMIFKRYKEGLLIHDLVWAFFEARDPYSLINIAEQLQSSDLKEVELARKLLGFIPGIDMKNDIDKKEQYLSFLDWIGKNNLFLCFTGESFQQTSNPVLYEIVLEAKYLCAAISVDTGKILKSVTEEDFKLLDNFKKLDKDTKLLLANFSFMLHQKDIHSWNTWLHYPIAEQIKIARGGLQ